MNEAIIGLNIRRSRCGSAVAGVCAGLAEYFDVDALAVRIVAVLALFASFGAVGVAYLMLWAILPLRSDDEPIYVHAEGCPDPSACPKLTRRACLAIWGIAFIGCLGFALALDLILVDVKWWQFWPILPFSFGIMMMLIPVRPRFHADLLACGVILVSLGFLLLFCSIGVLSWETFALAIKGEWPLLVLAIVCAAVGHLRKSNLMIFMSGLVVLVMVAFAMANFGVPGGRDALSVHVFPGSEYEIPLQAWQSE